MMQFFCSFILITVSYSLESSISHLVKVLLLEATQPLSDGEDVGVMHLEYQLCYTVNVVESLHDSGKV